MKGKKNEEKLCDEGNKMKSWRCKEEWKGWDKERGKKNSDKLKNENNMPLRERKDVTKIRIKKKIKGW